MDERAVLQRIAAGDEGAFDGVFRTHYAPLVGFVRSMLRDPAVAEEIAQDVMFELWRRRESLTITDSLRSYLYQAARNRALNHIRHLKIELTRQPEAREETSPSDAPDEQVTERDIEAAVRQAVAGLPPRCREVFELSRVNGLTYAEIAAALEISVKTVEAQMGKALRVLRGELADWL